jgi:hypothetical protein
MSFQISITDEHGKIMNSTNEAIKETPSPTAHQYETIDDIKKGIHTLADSIVTISDTSDQNELSKLKGKITTLFESTQNVKTKDEEAHKKELANIDIIDEALSWNLEFAKSRHKIDEQLEQRIKQLMKTHVDEYDKFCAIQRLKSEVVEKQIFNSKLYEHTILTLTKLQREVEKIEQKSKVSATQTTSQPTVKTTLQFVKKHTESASQGELEKVIIKAMSENNFSTVEELLKKEENTAPFIGAIRQTLKSPLPKEHRKRIRAFLTKTFPNYLQYVEYGKKNLGRYFTPKGIEVMVQHLIDKKAITFPCKVCASWDELDANITELIKSGKKIQPHTFIVKGKTIFNRESKHVTPIIFYQNEKGQYRIAAIDSTGKGETQLQQFCNSVRAETGSDCKGIYYAEIRQRDPMNCAIFSKHDLITFSKNPELTIDFFERLIEFNASNEDINKIHVLPRSYMLTAQSFSQLDQFFKMASDYGTEKIEKFKESTEKFKRKLNSHKEKVKIKNTLKDQNKFASREGYKFEGIVWAKIISEARQSQTKK